MGYMPGPIRICIRAGKSRTVTEYGLSRQPKIRSETGIYLVPLHEAPLSLGTNGYLTN